MKRRFTTLHEIRDTLHEKMNLSFPSFEAFPIEMGVTTRDFPLFLSGVSDLENPKNATLLQTLLSPSRYWVFPEQLHGSNVQFLTEEELQKGPRFRRIPETDGLLTNIPQTTLFVLTADCLPIFFLAPDPLTIGLAHAGWRGSAAAIARAAVEQLQRVTGQSSATFLVAFGPCIHPCCYQVSEELRSRFEGVMIERDGTFYLDLVKENRQQLEKAGIREENISDRSICTSCHPKLLYSYRREGERARRMVSWIRIKNVLA